MEQINVIFFALLSFFNIENGRIAAAKTTIIVNPHNNTIEIIQENLFTMIQQEQDSVITLEQWNELRSYKDDNMPWAKELDSFTAKNFELKKVNDNLQPHLTLTYTIEKDLRAMGIWFNKDKNQYSTNHIPSQNLQTKSGVLEGNYWIFDGSKSFTFTLEPFLEMPEQYKKLKQPLEELINE